MTNKIVKTLWQPMETAPKNGRESLFMTEEMGCVVLYWDDYRPENEWCSGFESEKLTPTHWMPLPPAPE